MRRAMLPDGQAGRDRPCRETMHVAILSASPRSAGVPCAGRRDTLSWTRLRELPLTTITRRPLCATDDAAICHQTRLFGCTAAKPNLHLKCEFFSA